LNEITNAIIICDYYMFGWKSKMKVHIFHPILWMDPWMHGNLLVLATKVNIFSIYNILMIKTYVASLELQFLFDNQLVSNCLLVFCIVDWHWQPKLLYLNYNIFIKIIYDDYLIIYHTCKLNFIDKITAY
jgi:hypothetical protein